MKDLMGLMKQAKEMQKKMEIAQGLVADIVVEGRSGSVDSSRLNLLAVET